MIPHALFNSQTSFHFFLWFRICICFVILFTYLVTYLYNFMQICLRKKRERIDNHDPDQFKNEAFHSILLAWIRKFTSFRFGKVPRSIHANSSCRKVQFRWWTSLAIANKKLAMIMKKATTKKDAIFFSSYYEIFNAIKTSRRVMTAPLPCEAQMTL